MPVIIGVMQSAGSWLKPAISICGKEVVHWVLFNPYTLGIHIISWPWRVEQSPSVRIIIRWCNELRPGAMSCMLKIRFQWYCLILWKYVYPFQTLVKFVARFSEANKSALVHACSATNRYLRQWWPLFVDAYMRHPTSTNQPHRFCTTCDDSWAQLKDFILAFVLSIP